MISQIPKWLFGAAIFLGFFLRSLTVGAVNNALYSAAMESVTTDELYHYVEVLADDVYEGRAAGSRGGHAAGQYLLKQLRPFHLPPAGTGDDYFQSFGD